ncbi:MvaI/BcnI family restriction endonuclease [Acinetobacter puyangensis]|uniref:MvaI/BcnI family restriction endonuclease n=1 Tax=Acinetobacter puyangensis TaxID=1096779 RepID=UPI003A4DA1D8
MNQRTPIELSTEQTELSFKNRKYLAQNGIDYGLLSITQTGLNKSIMDAVGSLRTYLKENQYHDYSDQKQGTHHKVLKPCQLVISDTSSQDQKVSLYRPETKSGDPRIWIYGLKSLASPGDELALIIDKGDLYAFNISKLDLSQNQILNQIIHDYEATAMELLGLLEDLSKKGRLQSVMQGRHDTAIGRTIEHALGIPINSSPFPDYKGIELKAGRLNKISNRTNLFAQVPDWSISTLKSSKEIVDKYGYERGSDLKLYCTLKTHTYNSQGLGFEINFEQDQLNELHITDGPVVSWLGDTLRTKLLEKHRETFWIKANSDIENDNEFFTLRSITHTKNPVSSQFLVLMEQGIITMDHLIKRKDKTGKTTEKGPLFKIKPEHLSLIFPEPKHYNL